MKKALLLIDIQNDYFPGGKMELVEMERVSRNATLMLSLFREKRLPIVHVQHISKRPAATFFLRESAGADIYEAVAPQPGEILIQKNFPNSYRDTALLRILKESEVDKLVICGAMSHMCIDATTRAAFDQGFGCIVIEDACTNRDLEYKGRVIEANQVHAAFMAALAAAYATVITVTEYIEKMAER